MKRVLLFLSATVAAATGAQLVYDGQLKAPAPKAQRFAGTIEAKELRLSVEHTGRILVFDVEEGQRLQAGALVATLDAKLLKAQRRRALAELKQASAQLAHLRALPRAVDVAQAKARCQEQRVQLKKAKADFERFRKIAARGSLQRTRLLDAEALVELLEKRLLSFERALEVVREGPSKAELRTAQALVEERQCQVEELDQRIERSRVLCPASGVVQRLHKQPGEFAERGQPLLTLLRDDVMYFETLIDGLLHSQLRLGQSLEIELESTGHRPLGEVVFLADRHSFTPKDALTRSKRSRLVFLCRLRLLKPAATLKPGMFAELIGPAQAGGKRR